MRSSFFKSPLEFSFEILGESWQQGQKLEGSLNISNHSAQQVPLANTRITLASATFKKIKTKDAKAFTTLKDFNFKQDVIEPNQTLNLKWDIQLDNDCPVTEKKESIHALYGNNQNPWDNGVIQLYINTHPMIKDFLNIFETFFRFKVKEFKNKKGILEAIMLPPSSARDYTSLLSLSCFFKYTPEALTIDYHYKINVLAANAAGATVEKKERKLSQTLNSKDYLMGPGMIDSQKVQGYISEILEQLKTKKIF